MTHRSWSNVLAISLVIFLTAIFAFAQKPAKSGPQYDTASEAKLKGTVTQVIEPSTPTDPVMMVVKTADSKTATVQLAPKDYLKEIDCWIKVGDLVEITGAKVMGAEDQIVARQVIFGNNTMVLRDDKGVPIWEQWKPSKAGG